MEYMQMTLDDWASMKEKLKQDLIGVQESFVRIGYTLRKIEEEKLFEKDGYVSIVDFAQAEYGLGASTVSRFININKKYSIDGNSDQLRPEFAQMGSSKLAEMLTLPDSDMTMIQPEATRGNIRELKQFNKAEPAAGVADDIKELIERFYQDNPDILNEVFENIDVGSTDSKMLSEIVNPGGNKSYKKGLFFLMMYENKIVIKKFGENPQDVTWEEFFDITQELFREQEGDKTWEKYFGQEEQAIPMGTASLKDIVTGNIKKPTKEEIEKAEQQYRGELQKDGETDQKPKREGENTAETDCGEDTNAMVPGGSDNQDETNQTGGEDGRTEKNDTTGEESSQGSGESIAVGTSTEQSREESSTEEIAPAQETAESLEETGVEVEVVPGVKVHIEDVEKASKAAKKEIIKAEIEATEQIRQQGNHKLPFGNRKQFMETLTEDGMAKYMAEEHNAGRLLKSALGYPSMIGIWLNEEVDWKGEPLEK